MDGCIKNKKGLLPLEWHIQCINLTTINEQHAIKSKLSTDKIKANRIRILTSRLVVEELNASGVSQG